MAPNMKDVFPKFALKQLSPYIAFIVIFVHNVVLDRDFECSCGNQLHECSLYMALPFLILLFLQLWTDKTFKRAWKYTCVWKCVKSSEKHCGCLSYSIKRYGKCKFVLVLLYHIIKAAFISALWVVYVLIDGDWYVCCQKDTNTKSSKHPDFSCKDKNKNITLEERKLIAEYKSKSLVIGLGILCVLIAAALLSVLRCFKCRCEDSNCCNEENLYYKLIVEEEEDVLKEILTTAAKEKLTKRIKDKLSSDKWTECFDVAEELIDNKTKPLANSQERNLKLEQLMLQVKRLLAEVQKLEPETRAAGGTGGAAGAAGGGPSGATSQPETPAAPEGTGEPSGGASQEEAIELLTVNTEEGKSELEQLKQEVDKLHTEVQKLEPETPAAEGTRGGASQEEAIELQTMNTEETLQLKQLKLEVKRLRAEVQKLEPETPAAARRTSAGTSQGEEHDEFTREERNLQLEHLKLEVEKLRAEVQRQENVQHVPSPP